MWYICAQIQHCSAIKRNEMSFAAKWMELEDVMLNEINRAQKDKYHIFSIMWKLKKLTL